MDTGTKKTVLQNTAIVLIVVLLVASFYYLFLALAIRKTITGFKQACAGYEVTEAIEYIDPVEARIPILVSAGVLGTYQKITGDEQMAKKVLTAVFNVLLGTDLKTEDLGEFVRSLRYNRVVLILKNAVVSGHDRIESTNIGINTCRRIIRMHGGSFDTEEVDSCYCVRL